MNSRITLRINKVNKEEIVQLNTAISALSDSHYRDFYIQLLQENAYVISISPMNMSEIKETLRALKRIFAAKRIEYKITC